MTEHRFPEVMTIATFSRLTSTSPSGFYRCAPEGVRPKVTRVKGFAPTITRADAEAWCEAQRRAHEEREALHQKAMTLARWCWKWNVSETTFYRWRRLGKAPETFKTDDGRVMISREAEKAWEAVHVVKVYPPDGGPWDREAAA